MIKLAVYFNSLIISIIILTITQNCYPQIYNTLEEGLYYDCKGLLFPFFVFVEISEDDKFYLSGFKPVAGEIFDIYDSLLICKCDSSRINDSLCYKIHNHKLTITVKKWNINLKLNKNKTKLLSYCRNRSLTFNDFHKIIDEVNKICYSPNCFQNVEIVISKYNLEEVADSLTYDAFLKYYYEIRPKIIHDAIEENKKTHK